MVTQLGTVFLKPGEVFTKAPSTVTPTGTVGGGTQIGSIEETLGGRFRGGGGGGRTLSQTEINRRVAKEKERERLALEKERMRVEAEKKFFLQEKERQIKIQAGTIAGQISEPDITRGFTVGRISGEGGVAGGVGVFRPGGTFFRTAVPKETRTFEAFERTGGFREVIGGRLIKDAEVRRPDDSLFFESTFQQPRLTVEAVEKPEGLLEGLQFGLREKRFIGTRAGKFAAGVGASLIGTAQFIKGIVTHPIETTKGIVKSIPQIPEKAAKIGLILRQEPEFATGFVAGEVLTFKGLGLAPKGALKVSDIFRTRGLKELPAKSIIAPEFFKGQKFPTIKKGQTAGQLLEEFKPILPGELKAAGFTATPKPFAKTTAAGRGTSELPGVFQAPRVSPRFLRVGGEGERKLFSLNIFDTIRPSIVRITPEDIKLVPGISPTQKQLSTSIKETQKFFETAPKGESFVPFIKTEKEAVIPFGTKLQFKEKRFFIKFEGRKVPIFEFRTAGGEISDIGKLPSIKEVSRSLSRGRIGEAGVITPLTSLTFVPSRSSLTSIATSRSIVPSLTTSIISSIPRFEVVPSTPSIAPSTSIQRITSGISSRGISGFDIISEPKPPKSFLPEGDLLKPVPQRIGRRTAERKRKIKERKLKGRERIIRPSFTGIITAGGIRSPLVGIEFEEPAFVTKFIGRDIGITPGTLRGTRTGLAPPRKRKVKKKKVKKKQTEDFIDLGLTNF